MNILVKSVLFYLQRFQIYGVLENVQLLGATLYINTHYNCGNSVCCRRWTRAMHCITPIVLYTKVDAKCDKLHGDSRRQTNAVDGPLRNLSKSTVWGKLPEQSKLISETCTHFCLTLHKLGLASVSKTSLIRSAVSIEHLYL